jgi:hypothetical protein
MFRRFALSHTLRAYFYVCQNHQKPTKSYNFCQSLLFRERKRRKREKEKSQKITLPWWSSQIGLARLWDFNLYCILQLICDSDYKRKTENYSRKRVHYMNERSFNCTKCTQRQNTTEFNGKIREMSSFVMTQTRESCSFHARQVKVWLSFHALDYLAPADFVFNLEEKRLRRWERQQMQEM